jgi:hypothetical protein
MPISLVDRDSPQAQEIAPLVVSGDVLV